MHKTDIVIIGAGPVGIFAVFELGLLKLSCHLIDNLDKVGGQCSELYPEKPIFDIPSRTSITGQELTDHLMAQARPFEPIFHLGQQAEKIEKIEDNNWKITTSLGKVVITRCIVIAGGAGSFVPRKPPIDNIWPVNVTSPVIATSLLTGIPVIADTIDVTIPIPAEGPSFGVAPSGT